MNKLKSTTLSFAAIAAIALTGCGGGGGGATTPAAPVASCDANYIDEVLSSDINSSITLDATKVYGMDGKVKVTNGATLTIPAGTKIAGCTASSFMVITPGAQINAQGTQAAPIVFTSQKDIKGLSSANAAGEWGGLVLAGNAYTHSGVVGYEADETVQFGNTDHTHDLESSGTLSYVVVKHTGYEVEKDKELNGLSLAGVGSGTTVSNVAIIGGLDDGLEIWGGTVNIDGLYVYNAQDDSVDTDLGYRGTIKNVLVQQVNVDSTNDHDSAGMEFGNDNDTITTDDTNATQPNIINYTAYVKGGGFYNKYDAGFRWNNVKFVSEKTTDTAQVSFRGADSYSTGAKNIDGDVCFKDTAVTLTATEAYSNTNTKDTSLDTAYKYFTTNAFTSNTGAIHLDDSVTCAGATEVNIWKGKAGSNNALETPSDALPSEITTNMTLTSDKVWLINGKVNVKSGAVLTIEPGTTLAGATASSYLVVEPGAQIDANGTQAAPIVFTSKKDVDGYSQDNAAGEWGGLVLAGNAYTHYSNNKYEADETVSFGSTDHTHDLDSSGVLNYVVIKHTGYEVEKDKELNGLSLAGVGSGTTITNVAIIGGLDDGLEIWGGTVNIDGLYVYNAQDDSVDTDLGYRGNISNVLVKQVNVDSVNNHDSASMEFGNDNNTITTDDTNATQPNITNFTAYVKGAGFYNKYDAGFRWNNVKFVSAKTLDTELITFRGEDSYLTGAKHVDGNVSFYDSALTLTDSSTYANLNAKDAVGTAYEYFVTNVGTTGLAAADAARLYVDDNTSATGVIEANVWKGTAGSNDPLEN
ncbi:hypothetical protein [Sulfurimonas microaerophilic]|uniref:hypothetical protein n=1 Tax=Sulfurimonas microaerophilic TaxID=3058392 RepID=UPI002714CBE6|nr:hypothetical protein [Sulfurimonas sp. hsl 1-7]